MTGTFRLSDSSGELDPAFLSSLSCPPRPAAPPAPKLLDPSPLNVLITGGAGYIGSHFSLLLLLQPHKYRIVSVDNLSRGDLRNVKRLQRLAQQHQRHYQFVEVDIADGPRLTSLMKDNKIDIVVHFAGYAYASESVTYPLRYFNNTVTGTNLLLSAMDAAGVSRLVYSSSSATYGAIQNEKCDLPINEMSPQVPVSPYGQSKLMAEHIIRAYAHSKHIDTPAKPFSFALLRYFNVVGADKKLRVGPLPRSEFSAWSRVVDSCFHAALNHQPMTIYGNDYATPDGTAIRDYIHVWDLVQAHLQLISAVHSNHQLAYNVGIGKGFSNAELVAACRKATNIDIPIKFGPRRIGDPPLVLGDGSKLQKEIGWKPQFYNLEETIRHAWAWRRKIDALQRQGRADDGSEDDVVAEEVAPQGQKESEDEAETETDENRRRRGARRSRKNSRTQPN